MTQVDDTDSLRERILSQAEVLFADKGYQGVSVREITAAADCNVAAVNYHFGNKQNLYLEVFRARWLPRAKRLHECFRRSLASQDAPSPASVIQALAQAFLIGPLSDEERHRHHQLMVRELWEPTEALEVVADQVMGPFFREFTDTLRLLMPKGIGVEEERMAFSALSILGMVLYFNFARVAVTRITGCEYDLAFKNRLVAHIVRFSCGGLDGIRTRRLGLCQQDPGDA